MKCLNRELLSLSLSWGPILGHCTISPSFPCFWCEATAVLMFTNNVILTVTYVHNRKLCQIIMLSPSNIEGLCPVQLDRCLLMKIIEHYCNDWLAITTVDNIGQWLCNHWSWRLELRVHPMLLFCLIGVDAWSRTLCT